MQYGNQSFARSFPPVPVKNQADNDEMRKPSANSYNCELCGSHFETDDKLDNHVKIQHVNPMDLNEKNLNALV
jgi:hypothetical protein